MPETTTTLSRTFEAFFNSEKSGAIVLIVGTLVALLVANSAAGPAWQAAWQAPLAGLTPQLWVNDLLMAVFFLFVGLELEREIYVGELSAPRKALLPIIAAIGGIAVPAAIHLFLNRGSETQAGAGIPMATDIAFALGVLSLLGKRVPAALKIFLTALAVIDDLCAMLVIAVFYTEKLQLAWLLGAVGVFVALVLINRAGVRRLAPFLIGGAAMWFLCLRSGVHPTLAGVALAFAIPFGKQVDDLASPSYRLENTLHFPIAFLVLPLFALANTGVAIAADWQGALLGSNSLGILAGLVLGKPLGIAGFSALAVALGVCQRPDDLGWGHIIGAGLLGGIGFTMSIFIANLAFPHDAGLVDASKTAVLLASLLAGVLGFVWLAVVPGPASGLRE
ncbi:Na+/H+ antiporter NhaA [soil metagenome]